MMKRIMKPLAILAAVVIVLGLGTAVYAATAKTPAEIISELTGKSVQTLSQERASGKTYGTIASESGKLEEFKAQMLEQKKTVLDQRVEQGRLTQDQADAIYSNMKENQANCTGDGQGQKMGPKAGVGCGMGYGMGNGRGTGNGTGQGYGNSSGRGLGCGINCN